MIRALLWDVDGTLAETERDGHRVAFNEAFAAAGLPWRWSATRYGELLAVAGGRERLLHDMRSQPDAPAGESARAQLAQRLHQLKNAHYAAIVGRGALRLRAGVEALLADCLESGVRLAVVTTTSRVNVQALLARQLGAQWGERFAAVVCAEEAPLKKPHPQVYHRALAVLRLGPGQAVAVEDSPAGLEAARRAGVPVVLTRSHYFPATPAAEALAAGPSLGQTHGWVPAVHEAAARITLAQLTRWYAQRMLAAPRNAAR
jgi:HAD superfamily hydrolase (TIGR01509 family)